MINTYVALDIETTGLNAIDDRILEIGAVKVVEGNIKDTFCVFVDPQMKIPPRITELTGITNSDVDGQKTQHEAVSDFIEFCGDHILLGHNILFDYGFIKNCAVNNGIEFEKNGIDTLKIARIFLPNLEKRNLSFLMEYYGIAQEKSHRAYFDAVAASMLYHKLVEDFYEGNENCFDAMPLIFNPKKRSPITPRQIKFLSDLVTQRNISLEKEIESLTKSEASRIIDMILSGVLK